VTKQPLASLKVVVDPTLPKDEIWVHPEMMCLLQQAFLEADIMRGFRAPSRDIEDRFSRDKLLLW
jgi:hypothetical protein